MAERGKKTHTNCDPRIIYNSTPTYWCVNRRKVRYAHCTSSHLTPHHLRCIPSSFFLSATSHSILYATIVLMMIKWSVANESGSGEVHFVHFIYISPLLFTLYGSICSMLMLKPRSLHRSFIRATTISANILRLFNSCKIEQ